MTKDSNGDYAGNFRKPRTSPANGGVADWGTVDPKILVKCIEVASKKGGALRLGYTRDGGAYAIGVYAGANYFTDYVRPTEDIDEYLTDLTESFNEYTGDAQTTPQKAPPKKR